MLTLTVQNSNEAIYITSDQIDFTDPDLTTVTVTSTINCCSTEYTGELTQFGSDDCWFNQSFDMETGGFSYNFITELTVNLNGTETNFIVTPTEYQILDGGSNRTAYMDALQAAVNAWLVANDIDSTFTITLSNGINTNSIITLEFDGFVPGMVPQTVTYTNSEDDVVQHIFSSCIEDETEATGLIYDGNLGVTPEFYGQTATLSDAIYTIKVEAEYEDGTIITERACTFIDAIIRCKIPLLIADGDYDAPILFDAIHTSNSCTDVDCDCTIACKLLSLLVDKLNQNLIANGSVSKCGCV